MGIQINCDECGNEFEEYPSRINEDKNNFCSRECSAEFKKDGEERTCAWCGDDVWVSQSFFDLDNHFCDKECEKQFKRKNWVGEDHPSWDGGNETVVCEECGDEYEVKPSEVDETRFCSIDCRRKNWEVEPNQLNCSECGSSFERKPYEVKGDHAFCSDSCHRSWISDRHSGNGNPMYVHGNQTHFYGENWLPKRRETLARDEYSCQACGMTRDEHYGEYGRDLEVHHKVPIRTFDVVEDANYLLNLVTLCTSCHPVGGQEPRPHNSLVAPEDAHSVVA
jgi:hypothetical protein